MKLLVILFVSVLGMTDVKAQVLYTPGDTVKGKNMNYCCIKQTKFTTKVKNTRNVHPFEKMYFDNGEVVPPRWGFGVSYNFEFKEFVQVFKDALTAEELNQLKGKRGIFQVNVIADKAGNAIELEFIFFTDDPVLSKLDPDRLFQLETKLKKLLKLKLSDDDRKIKNIKYIVAVSYRRDLK